jgi:hypothetical protein
MQLVLDIFVVEIPPPLNSKQDADSTSGPPSLPFPLQPSPPPPPQGSETSRKTAVRGVPQSQHSFQGVDIPHANSVAVGKALHISEYQFSQKIAERLLELTWCKHSTADHRTYRSCPTQSGHPHGADPK